MISTKGRACIESHSSCHVRTAREWDVEKAVKKSEGETVLAEQRQRVTRAQMKMAAKQSFETRGHHKGLICVRRDRAPQAPQVSDHHSTTISQSPQAPPPNYHHSHHTGYGVPATNTTCRLTPRRPPPINTQITSHYYRCLK